MDEQRFIHYNEPLLRNIRQEGMSFLNKPLTGGQDAHPTKKLTLCGTGILPVLENTKRLQLRAFSSPLTYSTTALKQNTEIPDFFKKPGI